YIAQRLTDDGAPSPSQYDPVRNPHRDPRGWSHSAIRAILDNPTYRGVRVWGRQQKYEVLVDPDDVAAGHETRMRWRDQAEWITPARRTHEALVTDDLADAVRFRMQARRGPDLVCSRESSTPYALRGMCTAARADGGCRAPLASESARPESFTAASWASRVLCPPNSPIIRLRCTCARTR
ncbi:MAG TPA: recombinase family protein, partial [Mycobacterium sp.]|nr:recombinase family protein [Mycobacterium sp.]